MVFHEFGQPISGEKFTGVVHITSSSDDFSHGVLVTTQLPVVLCHPDLPIGRHSVYEFLAQCDDSIIFLVGTDSSWMCPAPSHAHGLLPGLVELCAGSGGIGLGAEFAGGQTLVSVDIADLSIQHLAANAHGTPLKLDLTNFHSMKIIHQTCSAPIGTALMGFPCQPFSKQGSRLGSFDVRFEVFKCGLKTIFMLQPQSAILECVIPAGACAEIQHLLQLLAALMIWDVLQVHLHLHERWPCRRSRWWVLLLPRSWNHHGLQGWSPAAQFPTVGDIFSHWGTWSLQDEGDLQLYDYELEAYMDPAYGDDKRLLEMHDQANTLLHSYANALQACPCRCRSFPFSTASLRKQGLRGFFVNSLVHNNPRFLHPREAAHLLGFPSTVAFPHDVRASLALLGLSASPLQALWIYSTLKFNAAAANLQAPIPAPEEWLQRYCTTLLQLSQPLFHAHEPPQDQLLRITDIDGTELLIVSPLRVTAAQLLRAQRISLEWNETLGIQQDGKSLSLTAPLPPGDYKFTSGHGHMERAGPHHQITISIWHRGEHQLFIMTGGQFLFEALITLQLYHIKNLVDEQGKIYGADFRVWRPFRLTTLDPALWPPCLPPRLQATGLDSTQRGLHDQQIWQALLTLVTSSSQAPCLLVSPCAAAIMMDILPLHAYDGPFFHHHGDRHDSSAIYCIFAAKGHWALLAGQFQTHGICWTYSDGIPGHLHHEAQLLADLLAAQLDFPSLDFQEVCLLQQTAAYTCGTVALLHVCGLLGLFGTLTDEMVLGLHEHLLRHWTFAKLPHLHGAGPQTVETQLAALLVSKGVPWTTVSERATAAVHKLGSSAVQHALQQTNAWGALKALASRPGKTFQFVTKEELQVYVAQRAADKHGAQISTKKKQKKPPAAKPAELQLDPATLALLPGHFVDADHDQVDQIQLSQVTADTRGVALCNLPQALPFIKEGKKISTDGLALLILQEVPAELRAQADLSSLRFPVTYLPTNDPLLVHGSLLQLGDVEVLRKPQEELTNAMDVSNTAVIRLQVYRDELPLDWTTFTASPIKHVITHVPKLRICQNPRCDLRCSHFHVAVEDNFDQVIHEIWARRFQSLEGKLQPAPQAVVFQAFLRISAAALEEILPLVTDGIYFEPRCEANKAPDQDYAVVWIPSATRESAHHKLKTISHGLGLVRLKQRYGIRVKAVNEESVHHELRPHDSFVKTVVTKVWRIHPLPHGLSRAQISKLLQDWGWAARPMQPSRGSAEGGAWEIGSADDPPQPVLPAYGRDVLINMLKDKTQPERPVTMIAPKRAQEHLRTQKASQPASMVDPWLQPQHDPWAKHVPAGSAAMPPKHFDVLAQKLKDDLSASLQQQLSS